MKLAVRPHAFLKIATIADAVVLSCSVDPDFDDTANAAPLTGEGLMFQQEYPIYACPFRKA